MGIAADDSTRGKRRPQGCALRRGTGDTVGGLTIRQVANVLDGLGIHVEVYAGSNVATPAYLARRLWANRPAVVQGNTGALVGGPSQSTTGGVNHLVSVNDVRGGTTSVPKEVLVYDPVADGRRTGIARGPQWWPWSRLLKFAAALHPWGEDDPRVLGPGKLYCGIYPATPGAPIVGSTYRWHVDAGATVRIYTLRKYPGETIARIVSFRDQEWDNPASSAPCMRPVFRKTWDGTSGAVTVKILAGAFKDEYVRVGRGTEVTGGPP
jgi:hypothetical protein